MVLFPSYLMHAVPPNQGRATHHAGVQCDTGAADSFGYVIRVQRMKLRAGRGRRPAAVLLMLASGCAGLGYQVVWLQQGALWLGHEAAAVLAVVTAFFAGLALGSLTLGQRIETSPHALRWYIGCELAIGAWSLVLKPADVAGQWLAAAADWPR